MFRTIVVVTLFLTSFGLAQQNSWILTLKNGDQMNDIVPYNVDQGSLILLQDGPFVFIPIDDIAELRLDKSATRRTYRTVLKWGAYGVIAGAFTSIIIGYIERAKSPPPSPSQPGDFVITFPSGPGVDAMAGGVFGGLVGLIVGGVVYNQPSPGDTVYNFEELSAKKKMKILRKFVSQERELLQRHL